MQLVVLFLLIVFVLFPFANFLLVEYWIWYPFPAVFFFHFTTSFLPLAFFALFSFVVLTLTVGCVGFFVDVVVAGWLGVVCSLGFVRSLGFTSLPSTLNVLAAVSLNSLPSL